MTDAATDTPQLASPPVARPRATQRPGQRSADLSAILGRLAERAPTCRGMLVVTLDGLAVAGLPPADVDADVAAAMIVGAWTDAHRLTHDGLRHKLQRICLQSVGAQVIVQSVLGQLLLVLWTPADAGLGVPLLAVEDAAAEIARWLGRRRRLA